MDVVKAYCNYQQQLAGVVKPPLFITKMLKLLVKAADDSKYAVAEMT